MKRSICRVAFLVTLTWATAHVRAAELERFQLPNGMKVILRPVQGTKQTALVVLYSVGNDNDPAERSGVGHLIEHVYLTAGTAKEKGRTVQEFVEHYPEGANGQTGDRYTVFGYMFPDARLDAELKDAAARMSDLRVTAADLDREKPRLREELENMFSAFPGLAAQNLARELARPSAPGARSGGLINQIQAATLAEVQARTSRYYKPGNAVLVLSGSLDTAAAKKLVTTNFASIPAGEKPPALRKPDRPKFGTVSKLTVKPSDSDSKTTGCIAYPAPALDNDLYPAFLVLMTRLWMAGDKLGDGPVGSPVYFTPLDDGEIVALQTAAKTGEDAPQTTARLEAFVAETIAPKMKESEPASTREELGPILGVGEVAEAVLAQNLYGTAFTLGRLEQLGVNSATLEKGMRAVTEKELRRAAETYFAPGKHAAAFVEVKK